jgi:hypothetical protein
MEDGTVSLGRTGVLRVLMGARCFLTSRVRARCMVAVGLSGLGAHGPGVGLRELRATIDPRSDEEGSEQHDAGEQTGQTEHEGTKPRQGSTVNGQRYLLLQENACCRAGPVDC